MSKAASTHDNIAAGMKRCIPLWLALACLTCLPGCSTTQSDVRQVAIATDRSSAENTRLAVVGPNMTVSFQDSGSLHTLHSRADTVLAIGRIVARHYGFLIVSESEADFVLEVRKAFPDGGACISGVESAELDASYTLSLLTLGAFPATAVHCLVVQAALYAREGGEKELMGEFESNAGSVELVAGINDLKVYQRTVKAEDERRGLEASFGGLLSELIEEGAFQ